jgi:hypothetical protein
MLHFPLARSRPRSENQWVWDDRWLSDLEEALKRDKHPQNGWRLFCLRDLEGRSFGRIETMTIIEGAAVLGALAWLPHLIRLLKETVTRPEVRVIVPRTAEIGYTSLGPIVNLRIAFSVRRRDLVISSIRIRLKHESGEEKLLSWHGIVQRLAQFSPPETPPIPWEKEISVLAIKLTPREVEERFIRFQEDDYHTNKEAYEAKAAKKVSYLKGSNTYSADEFLQSEEMKDVYSFVKHWFNWKQGRYALTFEVDSPERFSLKDNRYEFSLNPLEVELLESNKAVIELGYEDQVKFNTPDYKPHNPSWNWANPVLKKDLST